MVINSDKFQKIIIRMLQGAKGEAGKDGISGDYDGLINKPSINGIQLDGDITGDILGLVSKDAIAQALYPAGSIYLSTVDVDPASLFGGVWQRIKDVFLLTAGDTYAGGSTGGSADAVVVAHTHEESTSNIRTSNKSSYRVLLKANATTSDANVTLADNDPNIFDYDLKTYSTGVSGTGKNMPPYLTVYAWKRIDGTQTDYTEDLNFTFSAGAIKTIEHTLDYGPVAGSDIRVTYNNGQIVLFTAGTSADYNVNGILVSYDGAKKIIFSASGSSTVSRTFSTVSYLADVPSEYPEPTPVPTEEVTETVGITIPPLSSTTENYSLANTPVSKTAIKVQIQGGGYGVLEPSFTAGSAYTGSLASGITIVYDGAKTFQFIPSGTQTIQNVIRTITYTIESGE